MPYTAFLASLFAFAVVAGSSAQAPQEEPRTFLLLVDDLHVDFRATPRLRELASRLLRPLMSGGNLCAIATTGASAVSVMPTSTSLTIDSAIRQLLGNALSPRETLFPRWGVAVDLELRNRATVAFSNAESAIDAVAASRGGRPFTVIYVSNGYETAVVPPPTDVIQAAMRANASVYPIDPRGFVNGPPAPSLSQADRDTYIQSTRNSLRAIADGTSGMPVFTAADLDTLQTRLTARR